MDTFLKMTCKSETTTQGKNDAVWSTLLMHEIPTRQDILPKGPKFGKRHSQAIILLVLVFCSYLIRIALSVAIVAMTDPTASINENVATYNWSNKSLIMASFLWGYCIPQIAAGYLADRYGAKWFLVGTTTITATAGLLIPSAAAYFSSTGVMVCRFIQGLSQGFLYPSVHGVLGKWIPSNERSRLGTMVYSGGPLGIVASMLITGYISASRFGWPMAFYLFSTVTLVVSAIYAYVGSNDPSSHPTISQEEKMYIKTNLSTHDNREDLAIPWKDILTSPPFFALLIVNVAFNYTHWTLITETTIYMNKVMKFDLKSNSTLSSLPYLLQFLVGFVSSFIADFLAIKNIISTTWIRKIMNNIGLAVAAVSLFILGRTGPDDVTLGVTLIILVGCFSGTSKSGHLVNHMDLAPNFSGVMMGITNGVAIIFSAFAPVLAQFIIKDEKNIGEWQTIFYITMGINILAIIINTFVTSGRRQVWNEGCTTS